MARTSFPNPEPTLGTATINAPTVNVFEDLPSSLSWRAIAAGVLLALAASVILNLLGMALGFSTIDPATGDTPGVSFFAILTAVWYVGTAILSAFLGGWVASYLSNRSGNNLGGWHGVVTWALSSLIVVWLVSSAIGGLVGGSLKAAGNAAQTAALAAAPAAADTNPLDALDSQVRAYTGNDPRALADVASHNIRLIVTGNPADADQLRAQAVNATMRANNMTEAQAQSYVAQLEQDYRLTAERVKAEAAKAAEATAKTISRVSLLTALTLIFGALAGWMGGNNATLCRLRHATRRI